MSYELNLDVIKSVSATSVCIYKCPDIQRQRLSKSFSSHMLSQSVSYSISATPCDLKLLTKLFALLEYFRGTGYVVVLILFTLI